MAARDLTERELEILRLYDSGMKLASIGEQLSIAPGTVNTTLARCAAKLGVKTRQQAADKAKREGLL